MIAEAPTLSLNERNRRWRMLRELMSRHAVDGLLVGGFHGRNRNETYVIDDLIEGCVVFPMSGEPAALTWNGGLVSRARESFARGVEPWATDYRVGLSPPEVAAVAREKGFERGRIGVVGMGAGGGDAEGYIPHRFLAGFADQLPEASLVDVSQAFAELVIVRSDEELELIRHGAIIAEAVCQKMLEVTRPGVGEEVIYAELAAETYRHGADLIYPYFTLQSGPHNISWGEPRWTQRGEPARRVQKGDMVQTEIHICFASIETQVQMAIALDPIDEVNQLCEDVARRSYEVALRTIRPGVKLAELVERMEEPLREAGCWAKTPLFHTAYPGWTGHTVVNIGQLEGTEEYQIESAARRQVIGGDLVLRSGMVLEVEPNASIGTHRVDIGGIVIVTETGAEEANSLPTRVRHVS